MIFRQAGRDHNGRCARSHDGASNSGDLRRAFACVTAIDSGAAACNVLPEVAIMGIGLNPAQLGRRDARRLAADRYDLSHVAFPD